MKTAPKEAILPNIPKGETADTYLFLPDRLSTTAEKEFGAAVFVTGLSVQQGAAGHGVAGALRSARPRWTHGQCSAAARSHAMESLCRTHWLERPSADLPTFCFTSTSDHFIESLKITQSHVALHLSLETLCSLFC